MSATLVNLTNFVWAIANDETGINIEKITHTYNQKRAEVLDKQGEVKGFVSYNPTTKIQVDGEIAGTTGLAALTFAAAITLANIRSGGGQSAGTVYLDEFSVEQTRESLEKLTATFTRYANF